MSKYILFCSQIANFATRSMLIPYEEFIKSDQRKNDLDLLRRNSKPLSFKEYQVDHLLTYEIIWMGNSGIMKNSEYLDIIENLSGYADGIDGYYQPQDKEWYDKAICGICKGFDHIKNYCTYRNLTELKGKKIEIVDGFLVLEIYNNKFYFNK